MDTIRTGRHMSRGREILPPMPIPVYNNFTDSDLESIYRYLRMIPALRNRVPKPQRFNAVLSDEAMPEMTGSELVHEIRKIRPDIPIVLMSGYVTSGLSARARDAGVAEVLSKPLVSSDIARSLASALQR